MRQPLVFCATLGITLGVTAANAADKPIVGLITKTNTNPFFVKMKAGAEEAATANGIELRSFAGKVDGDNDGQVAAIENLIASGAKGILITANDSRAIVPAIAKARAAGILVIALDTPLDPARMMKLVAVKHSPYKLSPDGRVTRKSREAEAFTSGLEAADKVLSELAGCLKDGA